MKQIRIYNRSSQDITDEGMLEAVLQLMSHGKHGDNYLHVSVSIGEKHFQIESRQTTTGYSFHIYDFGDTI